MLKIESNDNIAIIPMDDYNKGLKAISDLEILKMELQDEIDDNFNNTYHFIYLTNSIYDYRDREMKDEVIMKEQQYQIIKDQIKSEIEDEVKRSLKIDREYIERQLQKIREDRKEFERKIKKSKNIKWYHLLFGWKQLKL